MNATTRILVPVVVANELVVEFVPQHFRHAVRSSDVLVGGHLFPAVLMLSGATCWA